MQSKTKDTIIRHLKGIVAALEKEEMPTVVTYRGTALKDCTDDEIQEALQERLGRSFILLTDWQSMDIAITEEAQKRGLSLKR